MRTAIALAAFVGGLAGPPATRADMLYEYCGPRGLGYVAGGGQRTCILKPRGEGETSTAAPSVAAQPPSSNPYVGNSLNAADGMFNSGQNGCTSVSMAIQAATNPKIYGPTSDAQKAELRTYASRCGLRF